MRFLRSIIALLRNGAPSFSVLEAALLEGIAGQLDAVQAERLRRRVYSVNLVQRLDGGREVNAYVIKGGKPVFDQATRLVAHDEPSNLATFSFLAGDREEFAGVAWLVKGQLVSLEFDKVTEHILEESPTKVGLNIRI